MINIDLLTSKYDPRDYSVDYNRGTPVPWYAFDNFLPDDLLRKIQEEIETIPKHLWGEFTRNGSYMTECNNLRYSPTIRELALNFNSSEFVTWLERITGIQKLIPDPHLIGAGLSRNYADKGLKLHTDFNWNEQLQLNRSLNMILYFSKDWDPTWGGGLQFWNFERTKKLHTVDPLPNRLLVWNYDERLVHGYPEPMTCPENVSRDSFRMFYFKSYDTPLSPPHRSLYWFDPELGPIDNKESR